MSFIKELSRYRLLLVTGKGGVGKTTVTALLGMALAREKRRVLVAQLDSPPGLGELLGTGPVGSEPRPTDRNPGLWAVNVSPEKALAEFGRLRLKNKNHVRALLTHRATKGFIQALPGLRTLSYLGRLWHYTVEHLADGAPRFQHVVAETSGLGHLQRLLKQPTSLLQTIPWGPLRSDLIEIHRFLTHGSRCGIVVTSLAEELAVRETIELAAELSALGHSVALVVANALQPARLSGTQPLLDDLEQAGLASSSPQKVEPLVQEARLLVKRRGVNERALDKLRRAVDAPLLEMELQPAMGTERLEDMADQVRLLELGGEAQVGRDRAAVRGRTVSTPPSRAR
jgi:anion-transporting  ArsA/GET3 family ATPase